MVKVRLATPEDASQIAFVQVKTWQSAYQGIISDEYLEGLDKTLKAKSTWWANVAADETKNKHFFVATVDGKVVGFCHGKTEQEEGPPHDCEIKAVYVLPEHQRKSAGKLLIQRLIETFESKGYRSMIVWVLKDNSSSRKFYEALGGKYLTEKDFEIRNHPTVKIVSYEWPDISKIVR